ncbi:MAG: XRE family transcriptional regulator [Bacteroidetes bacterium CHB5]|nr:XRE family transcriptional regulator [Bacteroidetes bacterium CHB5]
MEFNQLGTSFRNRRKELGITQSQLAELAEVNINTVLRLERGTANPTLEVLAKIAKTLGMEIRLELKKKG